MWIVLLAGLIILLTIGLFMRIEIYYSTEILNNKMKNIPTYNVCNII